MKKTKLTKFISSTLIVASILALNPIPASAAWYKDNKGWWYSEGDSWATGLRQIGDKTYYFNSDGYMEKGMEVIGDKAYYFADNEPSKEAGELLQTEDLQGNFEIEKKWFYWGGGYTNTGHSDPLKDTPYSITIEVPKKLYYDTLVSTKSEKSSSAIPADYLNRTDDISVIKDFISQVMKVADEYNIGEEDRVNFLLTAALSGGIDKPASYSRGIKYVEIDPVKANLIKPSTNKALVNIYEANGRTAVIDEITNYGDKYKKTPVESFVENCGTSDDAEILAAKIMSVYGYDSLILSPKQTTIPMGTGVSGVFISGCPFSKNTVQMGSTKYSDIIKFNGKEYANMSYHDSFHSGTIDVGEYSGLDFSNYEQYCNVYPVSKISDSYN
jgi:hypothetical protein